MADDYPLIPLETRAELARWLNDNHESARGMWLVSWRRDDLGPRMLGGGLSGTIRVRRGDELEPEGRVRGDERSVEHATGEAEPDDPGADGGSGGGHPLSLVS